MNIILCGLKMSGKTTIGKMLASKLKRPFIDTDYLIEDTYVKTTGTTASCREIFLQNGETFFRRFEKQQITSLNCLQKSIISLGGGSLCDPDNVEFLKSLGYMIYLKTPLSIIWNRILQHKELPSYLDPHDPEKSFYAIAQKRLPIYEEAAHDSIETTHLSTQEIVTILLNHRMIKDGQ